MSTVKPPATARSSLRRTVTEGAEIALLIGLFFLGVLHWMVFYNWGRVDLHYWDWFKEDTYFQVLRQMVETGRLPLHFDQERHGEKFLTQFTDKFLGLPETNLAPDILLLPLIPETGRFLLVHTLLLYTVGFVGCLLLRRRYGLGPLPFATLWLLFHFNGYITSHLSVGHSMWNGYFLLPFFAISLLDAIDRPRALMPGLLLAAAAFGMMLVGAIHQVLWCWMFLGLFAAFRPRHWLQMLVALGFGGWLCFFRLLPAAVIFWNKPEAHFLTGYPGLGEVWDGFVVRHGPYEEPVPSLFSQPLYWWEYDIYLGFTGFALLLYFGVYRRWRNDPEIAALRYPGLDGPMVVLAWLSVNYFFTGIANLPIPLFSAERVSARFLIVPVVMLLVLAVIQMEHLLRTQRLPAAVYALLIGGLFQTAFALGEHNWVWKIPPPHSPPPPIPRLIDSSPDQLYVASVYLSAVVSLAGAVVWWVAVLRLRRMPSLEPEGVAPEAAASAESEVARGGSSACRDSRSDLH